MRRNKEFFIHILLLFVICAAGCSRREEVGEHHEIKTKTEQMPDLADTVDTSDMEEYVHLGTQFYQGERIQIWGERRQEGGGIYLHKEDGSRELLMEKVHSYFLNDKWWIDEEGRCYIIKNQEIIRPDMDDILWTDTAFKTFEGVVFANQLDQNGSVSDICQIEDGRIIVLINQIPGTKLAELDPESGRLDVIQDISGSMSGAFLIAAEGNAVLLLDHSGIWDCSLADGKVGSRISFSGTSYTLKDDNYDFENYLVKEDFRMLEDGETELLWSDGTVEYMSLEQVTEDRESLVLRIQMPSSWMKEQIIKFNQQNEDYYIVIDEAEDSEWDRFPEQTDMELGAGRGADIVSSDAVGDAYSLLEKGVFEELTSFMEASGIREEDYFSGAFSGWKYDGRIYGVNYTAEVEGMCMDKAFAGEEGISGIEDLVDRLLDYDNDAIFQKGLNASGVMNYFLKDSESLCGMVDFENGTCDFSKELFGRMLEAAKRYGDGPGREGWKSLSIPNQYFSFYCFNDSSYLEKIEKLSTGYLFDNGGQTEMRSHILAVNGSSDKKEGAWEFICFLLGEEVQSDFYTEESRAMVGRGNNMGSFPVKKSAFEKLCGMHSEIINGGRDTFMGGEQDTLITGLTEARKAELKTALEEAGTAPLRTGPVLQIILEEAEEYFSGAKSIEEVRAMAENRVQLYLDEQ